MSLVALLLRAPHVRLSSRAGLALLAAGRLRRSPACTLRSPVLVGPPPVPRLGPLLVARDGRPPALVWVRPGLQAADLDLCACPDICVSSLLLVVAAPLRLFALLVWPLLLSLFVFSLLCLGRAGARQLHVVPRDGPISGALKALGLTTLLKVDQIQRVHVLLTLIDLG